MNELERTLIGDSAAAPPTHILESLSSEVANRMVPGAPHTIYEELWHVAFWQHLTLLWIDGIEAPYPENASFGFPMHAEAQKEQWDELCQRFLDESLKAAALTQDSDKLQQSIRCPSRTGHPIRIMSVREQLESLAAHNAYHLGRIVLLRQLNDAWPPPSGGDTW